MTNVVLGSPMSQTLAEVEDGNRKELITILISQLRNRFPKKTFFLSNKKLKSSKSKEVFDGSCLSISEKEGLFSRTVLVLAVMNSEKVRCIIFKKSEQIGSLIPETVRWFARQCGISEKNVEIEVQG